MVLIFGLYHVPYDKVQQRILNAKSVGITHFDTAQLYGNERICAETCTESDTITTKIYAANTPGQVDKLVKRSLRRFSGTSNNSSIDCMLLHRPMPHECWSALCLHADKFKRVGVSNYDMNGLKHLLEYCQSMNLKPPDVHQMEIHPFVDCDALIAFCKDKGIIVQGHTILAQGKFLNYPPLVNMATKYSTTSASVLTKWALSKNIDICVGSSDMEHLCEIVNSHTVLLSDEDIQNMNNWHKTAPYRFYDKVNRLPHTLIGINDQKNYVDQVVRQLEKDRQSDYPSDICDYLPLAGESYRSVGKTIADALYPGGKSDSSLTKYRILIKTLRRKRIEHRKINTLHKKGLSCCIVRRTSGPYSDSITQPKPMPVDVTHPSEFVPLFDYLTSSEVPPQSDTIFVRGAVFPDGRIDLCKQVVGPTSIQQLCQTIQKSKIVGHFLLGNNVALQENEERGAEAFASVMRDNNKHIETWYLAGNCIGPTAIRIMSDALSTNTKCKALWLKRNPVGPIGATYLNSMLRINETLVLLDLHNCALGDTGINNLLAAPELIQTLKHLYLDANGIESVDSLCAWIFVAKPVSLSLSINRLGDKNIIHLAEILQNNPYIKRLCLSSTHMHNQGLKAIVDTALTCPNLISLNVGCYKSTADMGEHPGNFFNDTVISDLTHLLTESKSLQYLNTSGSKISEEGLLSLRRMPNISMDLGKGPWHHIHNKDALRFVKQPKRVVHIDSIYRGIL